MVAVDLARGLVVDLSIVRLHRPGLIPGLIYFEFWFLFNAPEVHTAPMSTEAFGSQNVSYIND